LQKQSLPILLSLFYVFRRPGYDEKRKEMYGSGIFNETSGSCDGDAGYGGFADKGPSAGDNQVFSVL